MRIGLFGQFGSGNTGNDGSLEAMLRQLQRTDPQIEVICICSGPDVIRNTYGIETVPIGGYAPSNRLLRAADRFLMQAPRRIWNFANSMALGRKLDFLIVPGTGFLDDFSADPFGWPFAILRWSLAARLSGAELLMVSIGAGPINHPLSRWFMRQSALMATFRSYRDTISHEFMKTLGVQQAGDSVSADLAFSLPKATETILPHNDPQQHIERIGIGIMAYRGWKRRDGNGNSIYSNYLKKMSIVIQSQLQQGRTVRLLTGDNIDHAAIDDLMALLPPADHNQQLIYEPIASLHDLMKQIAQTDIVLASRYHNVICALHMGRPTISLSYARKNDVLLADNGLSEFCHHVESFDPPTLIRQIDDMLLRRPELEQAVRAGTDQYRLHLEWQEQNLHQKLLKHKNGLDTRRNRTH
ncbi:dTDP-4-dehydrorhamnose 3,5-epimerase [Brucella tritici]|uniref:polysaccharide pyruvyl transferase family protein n=1 Tax=Brucella tritici TaxID=94626 RepID=UPI00124E5745|nr:polysaccharide pyruvyl transferase family protein [Brucella tritici]KAB2674935.1 dTDP-4-dehydrorhamnose 3,5-epimerase [Brucella tritici]